MAEKIVSFYAVATEALTPNEYLHTIIQMYWYLANNDPVSIVL